jgi:hypothetical protein
VLGSILRWDKFYLDWGKYTEQSPLRHTLTWSSHLPYVLSGRFPIYFTISFWLLLSPVYSPWLITRNDHITVHSLMEVRPFWEPANCAAVQELPSILWNPKFLLNKGSSQSLVIQWLRLALSKEPDWVGVFLSHLKTETDPLLSRIPDDGESPKPSNSEMKNSC